MSHDVQTPSRGEGGGIAMLFFGAVVALAMALTYGVVALADGRSDERVTDSAALAAALESQRFELRTEMSETVRAAYEQGWREAMVAVDSSDRGRAFADACAQLWQGKRP